MWGCSDNNKLGFANTICCDTLRPVWHEFFSGIPIRTAFLGLNNSFALTRDNQVYAWGSSARGKFGIPQSSDWKNIVPKKLYMKGTLDVSQIGVGPFHTMFLSKDGELYVCGSSNEGKLGIFRLEEKMPGVGDEGNYIIDSPWKLEEGCPTKFFMSLEGTDVFEHYTEFKQFYNS